MSDLVILQFEDRSVVVAKPSDEVQARRFAYQAFHLTHDEASRLVFSVKLKGTVAEVHRSAWSRLKNHERVEVVLPDTDTDLSSDDDSDGDSLDLQVPRRLKSEPVAAALPVERNASQTPSARPGTDWYIEIFTVTGKRVWPPSPKLRS